MIFLRLSDTQECLESSLIEKENSLAQTSEKLELISGLKESLSQKEIQYKDVSEKLLQAEHAVSSPSVVSNVDSDKLRTSVFI